MISVGLAQYHPARTAGENLARVADLARRAAAEQLDLLCFSHDFLGESEPDGGAAVDTMLALAREHCCHILTGRVYLADGSLAQSVYVDRNRGLSGSVPDGAVAALNTCLGPTMVLSERQAYNPLTDQEAARMRPKAMLMQANAISLLELEAIKELALERSYNQAHLVICTSDVGPCADELCMGTSLAVFQGEILAEADIAAEELLVFTVDLEKFIDYDVLRDPVFIPELLKQKYHY